MISVDHFEWSDPFLIDDQLTAEERLIRDTAHAYAQDQLQPRATAAFDTETTDPKIFGKWANWACSA